MAQLVSSTVIQSRYAYYYHSLPSSTVVDGDYVPVNGQIVTFDTGDITQTHTITINQDDICENMPNENFFSNVALASGIPDITVTVPRATITIDDTNEIECRMY